MTKLAGGNIAIALLANSLATGAMLVVLILTFGPVSGAHINRRLALRSPSQATWRGERSCPTSPRRSLVQWLA
jgi:hypothetical protein